MKCAHVRRLFGAYWDDDTTQAEREWLETHLASCASCRREYDDLAKVLEWTGSLPRVEVSPDFVERTLARARRAAPVGDSLPRPSVSWVPVTAAAALLLVAGTLVVPWLSVGPRSRTATRASAPSPAREAVLVQPTSAPLASNRPGHGSASGATASISDSLFDHSDDVEFILDPVTLRRGRATVTRTPASPQAEQAIITF
jgi:hypothetical protein